MSDSYALIPITHEIRTWLKSEGVESPVIDGKPITLQELKSIVLALPNVSATWSNGPEFFDGIINSTLGMSTTIIVGDPGHGANICEFHFRGGSRELIEYIVGGIAKIAGPQVIYAHSGDFTKVVYN